MVMAMLSAFYGEEAVRQRVSGQKDALLACGLQRSVYWGSMAYGHFILTFIPIVFGQSFGCDSLKM